jgi:hypothetical protein
LIAGAKKIKQVMEQFEHQYMNIIDNLRIMADALVLLNPDKNKQYQPGKAAEEL